MFLVATSPGYSEKALVDEASEPGAGDVDDCFAGGHAEEFVQLTSPEFLVEVLVRSVHHGLVGARVLGRLGVVLDRCEFRNDLWVVARSVSRASAPAETVVRCSI